jgi:hypothetical protein
MNKTVKHATSKILAVLYNSFLSFYLLSTLQYWNVLKKKGRDCEYVV